MVIIQIKCKDCGYYFSASQDEEELYKEKIFSKLVRCKECRDKRKAQRL